MEVEALAESIFPIHTLEIVQGGRVVAATEEPQGARRLTLQAKRQGRGQHLAGGALRRAALLRDGALPATAGRAGCSPTPRRSMSRCGGAWELFDPATAQYMLTLIEGSLAYIRNTAAHDPPGSVTHHHGEEDHLAFLERPFHEAPPPIHRRMHELGIRALIGGPF